MAKPLVTDDLWTAVQPLLPPEPPKPRGGRPRASDRAALSGILIVLRTGIPWEDVPAEMGVCGMTCWRRLRDWRAAGVWARLHRVRLERRHGADKLDWSRASLDSAAAPAKRMARPVRKRYPRAGPGSLRQRIRPSGMPLAKMEIRASRAS